MNRIILSLAMFLLMACNRVEPTDASSDLNPDLPLELSVSAHSSTRGELVESASDMGTIGLYCAHTGEKGWSSDADFSKLNNSRFYISDQAEWSIDGDPEPWGYETMSDKYTFFAYSPHTKNTQGVTTNIVDGELIINYQVPTNSADQPDLMYAKPCKDIFPQVITGVPLSFYHVLSSVSFGVTTKTNTKITAIDITGVANQGTLEWNYTDNTPTWDLGESISEHFSVEVDNYTLDEDNSAQVNTDRGYLMMIPQKLPSGAKVTLTLDNNEVMELTIPANSEWVAGNRYHYVINLDEGSFIFDSSQISNCYIINPTPGEDTLVQIPIEDRINDFWLNYSGKNREEITSESSTLDYSVLLIWEDFDTKLSFTSDIVYDADGKMAAQLTLPACYQEGNLFFAVQEEDEDGYKTTLWSWHLWFTDYNPDAIAAANIYSIEAGADKAYERSGYEGKVHRYADVAGATDSVAVWSGIYKDKFIMDRNIGERDEYSADYGAGAVYYQFGRKDPLPGVGARDASGTYSTSMRNSSSIDFYLAVYYCYDYFYPKASVSYNWSDEDAARKGIYIWYDDTISSWGYTTGKSIFDPSPLGWRVPVICAWSNFHKTGSSQTNSDRDKSVGEYSMYGCRNPESSGSLTDAQDIGYVWSANQYDSESSYCLYITGTKVNAQKKIYVSYGLPIRAIQE
ncbi:MAG: fimbrillin family protein [Rikenellaceae bacterium]